MIKERINSNLIVAAEAEVAVAAAAADLVGERSDSGRRSC